MVFVEGDFYSMCTKICEKRFSFFITMTVSRNEY